MMLRNSRLFFARNDPAIIFRTYATWKVDNMNLEDVREKFLQLSETAKKKYSSVDFSHTWETNPEKNAAELTMTVKKLGSSSIKFLFKTEKDPSHHITISEQSRDVAFLHTPFEIALDEGLETIAKEIGAQKKE